MAAKERAHIAPKIFIIEFTDQLSCSKTFGLYLQSYRVLTLSFFLEAEKEG